jgi:hypothetical protein
MRNRILTSTTERGIAGLGVVVAATTVAVLAIGTAQGAVGPANPAPLVPSPMATTNAGCNRLPVSEREFCKSQVGWARVSTADVAIDQNASARTASEMKACKSLPVSDRYICEDQAGYGQKVPRQTTSSEAQRGALTSAYARYRKAVADCNRMPVSDRTICVSQAGYASRLTSTG